MSGVNMDALAAQYEAQIETLNGKIAELEAEIARAARRYELYIRKYRLEEMAEDTRYALNLIKNYLKEDE
jgi:hypothetical protein